MSRSGVGLDPKCVPAYEELKLGRGGLKFIVYKMSEDQRSIVVDTQSMDTDYDKFLEALPLSECRYAVYDFEYELEGGEGKRKKICFISWSPDGARIKGKMIYASSKEAIRRALTGIAAEIQATEYAEVAYETILEKVSKKK